ncbi:MAG: ABC-type transport auxiliary lipoprotein family protein [Myxococcota bacterium]
MPFRIAFALGLAFCALGAAACLGRSPDVHYYALGFEPLPPADRVAPEVAVQIGPVRLPAYLERPELARRRTSGEIELDATHRWLDSFERNFLRAVSLGVGERLASTRVVAHPSKAPFPIDYRVRLHVDDLIVDGVDTLHVRIRWALIGPRDRSSDSGAAPPARLFTFETRRERVGSGAAARVGAYEAVLDELATRIAAIIAEAETGGQAPAAAPEAGPATGA